MKRRYFLKQAINRARMARMMAKAVDLFIVLVLSVFFYPLGLGLSAIYIGISDSLQNGQSVGKKFMGFQVISLEDGNPCTVKQSFIRNIPILVPLVLAMFPLIGPILAIVAGTFLLVLEIFFLFKLDSGHRLGDVMADTSVMGHDGTQIVTKKKKQASWFPENGATPT
ncbi:MAG: RDD family protein [Halobacteriovoraceae bacterium]|nr:RDD family protein [Halobacteriovoraceae bacterium]